MRNGLAPILFNRPGWAPRGASLAFDFTKGRVWTPNAVRPATALLTTTRSSSGDYADNSAGVWSSFAANIPRITDKGLLVEEARTNSIRNNSMQGATAGVIGSGGAYPTNWTRTGDTGVVVTVAIGAENGIDYIDLRVAGTTDSTGFNLFFDTANAIAALNAQVWAGTVFAKLAGGAFTNVTAAVLRMYEYNAVPAALAFSDTSILGMTSTLSRFANVRTNNQATTAFQRQAVSFGWSIGVSVDFTIRIGWPQLELGAFATSPIRTTSAAATRAADAITVNNFSSWFTAGPGTMYVDATALSTAIATNSAFQIDDGTTNNRYAAQIDGAGDSAGGLILTGGVGQATLSGTMAANNKVGFAWATNDAAMSLNGGTVQTDATVTLPSGLTTARIGSNSASFFSGYLRRLIYKPVRDPNGALQAWGA